MSGTSTKPYLIRAIHQWCIDNNYTPYLAVSVLDEQVQVPYDYVKDGEIVLNASYNATRDLQLGNDFITFSARFNGISRDISVPVGTVIAIFSRETGAGMHFDPEESIPTPPAPAAPEDKPKGRAKLQIIK